MNGQGYTRDEICNALALWDEKEAERYEELRKRLKHGLRPEQIVAWGDME